MSGLSRYSLEQTITGTLYAALYTSPPSYAGGGTELSYAGYARVSHASWLTFNDPDGEFTERRNNGAIVFPAASTDVKDVGWWGLHTAAVAGDLVAWGPLLDGAGVPFTVNIPSGDVPRFITEDVRVRAL